VVGHSLSGSGIAMLHSADMLLTTACHCMPIAAALQSWQCICHARNAYA
jgi:hypothetical protein